MFLVYLLFLFFTQKQYPKKNIILLHYNHNFRKNSQKEQAFLQQYFQSYTFITANYTGTLFKEEILRKARYEFFYNVLFTTHKNKKKYLLLWHHLNDRIETTLLHMIRGCSEKGIKNMTFYTPPYILRPLIEIPKSMILSYCKNYSLPFFLDETNENATISKRNFIRKHVVEPLESISHKDKTLWWKLYSSFLDLYHFYEKHSYCFEHTLTFTPVKQSQYWKCESIVSIKHPLTSKQAIYTLFQKLKLHHFLYSNTLEEFLKFFTTCNHGVKTFKAYTFIILYSVIYIVKGNKEFYVPNNHFPKDTFLPINDGGNYSFWDFIVPIYTETYKGNYLRFPKHDDTFHGKKLTRYFIEKKIPFFWRPYIPVISNNHNEILYVHNDPTYR